MQQFSSNFIAIKNAQETLGQWVQLVEVSIPSSTVCLTSFTDTITYAGKTYSPVPLTVGNERQSTDGQLPQTSISVSNFGGFAYRFVSQNDLTQREVTLRLINTLSSSGDESKARLWIRGATFTADVATFELGLPLDFESQGPRRTYNRRDFPGIPLNLRAYSFV